MEITSVTLIDRGTDGNEQRFRRHRKVRKSSYFSVDKFIEHSYGHSELTVKKDTATDVMEPSAILITREVPTQFEIDVAAEFGIPIRYVNINKYDQAPKFWCLIEDYDYYGFSRKKLASKKAIKKF